MNGFNVRRTSTDLAAVTLHFYADEDKDPTTPKGKAWYDQTVKAYPGGATSLGFRREMLIDWAAGQGELIFPEFIGLEAELVIDPFPLGDQWTFYGGLDWGNRNPVSFHVYAVGPNNEKVVTWEYYEPGSLTNVYEVSKMMKHVCPYYDRIQTIFYDPAMNAENQQRKDGNTSIARMFIEDVPEEDRVGCLVAAHGRSDMLAVQLTKVYLEERSLKFFKTCPRSIEEFRNLKYPERADDKNEPEKILDKDNHAWDDYKYFVLSHPTGQLVNAGPKYGTLEYYNKAVMLASEIAETTGRSMQDVFNDVYGKPL